MRIIAWALAAICVLIDLAGWAATLHLGWIAAAPHHATEVNRAFMLGIFSFVGLFIAGGAVLFAVEVEENR